MFLDDFPDNSLDSGLNPEKEDYVESRTITLPESYRNVHDFLDYCVKRSRNGRTIDEEYVKALFGLAHFPFPKGLKEIEHERIDVGNGEIRYRISLKDVVRLRKRSI